MSNLEPSEIQGMVDNAIGERFRRIDALLTQLQRDLFRRWLFAVVGLVIAGLAIYFVAQQAHTTAQNVQLDRHTSILKTCQNQNARNASTIARLNRNSQEAQTPAGLKRFQAQLGAIGVHVTIAQAKHFQTLSTAQNSSTIALINALQPHQDCQALAAHQAPLQ